MSNLLIANTLKNIEPEWLANYLTNSGWVIEGQIQDLASIWHRPEPDNYEFEVIQPTNSSMNGYKQRIYDALSALAQFEKRDIQLLAKEIQFYNVDTVKIRVVHHDVGDGTIPLEDGVSLIEKTKDLLVASTLATFQKRKHYSGNKPIKVQNFIEQLRLGQTEVGSFVVNVLAPIIIEDDHQQTCDESSLTRMVTSNLGKSLEAISKSIEEYSESHDIFTFERVIEDGVSANLCDALIGLSGKTQSRSFHINIETAGIEPDLQPFTKKHIFEPKQVPLLESASQYFKGSYTKKDFNVLGIVVGTKHLPHENSGIIKVQSSINETLKTITIRLEMEQYWQAHDAHKSEAILKCTGDLVVTHNSAKLESPRGFGIIPNVDLFESASILIERINEQKLIGRIEDEDKDENGESSN